jgi:hypothetical protein
MRMLPGALWFVSDAPLAPVDVAVLRDTRYWIRNAEIVERGERRVRVAQLLQASYAHFLPST